jgi:hypothetical protein
MKFNAALAKSLLMAASIGMVVPVIAQTTSKKAPSKPEAGKPKPAPTPAPAAEEADTPLPGSVVVRPGGGFLSLSLQDGHFKLSFYDAKKNPVPADAVRATTRWDPKNKSGDLRSVLNPSPDGSSLVGNVFVRPPLVFKVYLTLLGADDSVIESHAIDFRG